MPVCLKSGITAKPLNVRIHNFGFRFVITMCILCNFFVFLSFKITELWPFLGCLVGDGDHGCQFWPQSRSDLSQMRQISDFLSKGM